MSEAEVVRFDVEDGVGVITVDYPPVNALGPGVREGIIAAVAKGEADASVKAMVLIGAGLVLSVAATGERAGLLLTNYVDQEMTSSGAVVRLAMTALPGAILLYWRSRFDLAPSERWIWMMLSAAGLAALALDEVFQSAEVISKINFTVTGSFDKPVVTEVNRHSTEVPVPVRVAQPDSTNEQPMPSDQPTQQPGKQPHG